MLSPFSLLESHHIATLIGDSKRYLAIRTHYTDCYLPGPERPAAILVSAYPDYNDAKQCIDGIQNDRLRSILDLQDDNHRKMILDMIKGTRYLVYSAMENLSEEKALLANR